MDGIIATRLYGRLQSANMSHPREMSSLYEILISNSAAGIKNPEGNTTYNILFNQVEYLEEDRVKRFMDLDRMDIIDLDMDGVKDSVFESEIYDAYPITFSKNIERIILNSLRSRDPAQTINLPQDFIPPSPELNTIKCGNSPISHYAPKLSGVVR